MENTIKLSRKVIETQRDLYTDLYVAARDYDTMLNDKPSYLQGSAHAMCKLFTDLLENDPEDCLVDEEKIKLMVSDLYKTLLAEVENKNRHFNF